MGESPPMLDYRLPRDDREKSSAIAPAVIAFIVTTALFALMIFPNRAWVCFTRAGARMYGPQDQYVHDFHRISAYAYGTGMCLIGGAIFGVSLLLLGVRGGKESRYWPWAAAFGAGYVLAVCGGIAFAEFLAGPNTGGPRDWEVAAHAGVVLLYPVVAGWSVGAISRHFQRPIALLTPK